jgi:hypothetical protein
VNGLFDDGKQLALKRPMPPRCALSKAPNNLVGDVLDRQIHVMVPIWFHFGTY